MAGRSDYTFGDTDAASERLALVHRVFAAPSAALLARVGGTPHVVVDLGCGPGHSTALLRDRFPKARLIGVEASTAFAAEARERVPDAQIVVADATSVALPVPADVVYARLLLAHVADVAGAIVRWRTQLAPHGVVVLDEVESIESDDPVFRTYEQIVGAMVGARGASVSAGPRIAAALAGDAAVVHDAVVRYDVAPADAAAMFALNLQTWRHDAWVRANVATREIDALAAALARPDVRAPITWYLHQTIAGPPA